MRHSWIIPIIYVLITQGGHTSKVTWTDDQPVDTIMQDRANNTPGLTYQIVDKTTFDAVVVLGRQDNISKQTDVGDLKNKGKTADERLDALIKVLGY